ncbi:MAG: NADH-quinone oxidoreductase subunit D [Candidatus Obscuribacterales bacterium]|nr:NADH-quinone oxidoreductase subunit D [Candidatus Obscuribacterales bacterium]
MATELTSQDQFFTSPELKTDEMILNMGPQHPATHGVLRLIVTLDGEIVKHVEPVLGHLHRAQEWQGQNRTWFQYQALIDRVDYLSGMYTSWALSRVAEQIDNINVPKRAEYLRVIAAEMNRITSHLLWLGTYLIDLGAMFGFPFYPFREREKLLSLLEAIAGQRMMFNYIRIGGVMRNPPFGWFDKAKHFTEEFDARIDEYEAIVTENPIFLKRTVGVGILKKEIAMAYGVSGPCLRASGVNLDLRRTKPYSVYPELEFDVPVMHGDGDTRDRYACRIKEMRESNRIIKQCLEKIPGGTTEELRKSLGVTGPEKDDDKSLDPNFKIIAKKQNAGLRVKAGEVFAAVESPRGTIGCYVVSNGSEKPYRFRWRNPSFCNLSVLHELLVGSPIADVMAIFGSIDVILPDVDR